MRELVTVESVLEALGEGDKRAGRLVLMALTGRKTQYVTNWLAAGRLPAWSFLTVSKELERRGYSATPTLWGIAEPTSPAEVRAS